MLTQQLIMIITTIIYLASRVRDSLQIEPISCQSNFTEHYAQAYHPALMTSCGGGGGRHSVDELHEFSAPLVLH